MWSTPFLWCPGIDSEPSPSKTGNDAHLLFSRFIKQSQNRDTDLGQPCPVMFSKRRSPINHYGTAWHTRPTPPPPPAAMPTTLQQPGPFQSGMVTGAPVWFVLMWKMSLRPERAVKSEESRRLPSKPKQHLSGTNSVPGARLGTMAASPLITPHPEGHRSQHLQRGTQASETSATGHGEAA